MTADSGRQAGEAGGHGGPPLHRFGVVIASSFSQGDGTSFAKTGLTGNCEGNSIEEFALSK